MERQRVAVIGYGRFGQFWAGLLAQQHDVMVYDQAPIKDKVNIAADLAELMQHTEAVFLCVPINQVEGSIRAIKPHLKPGTIVFDTCSVKRHPADLLHSQLGGIPNVELVATHPMFGPDSARGGLQGLPMVMWPLLSSTQKYVHWRTYFQGLGLHIVEMPPDEHDQLAANSQGITHYIGRILGELNLQPTPIDTSGYKIMRSLTEQTNNDSWELFRDLQHYNPYTKEMRLRLETALDKVYTMLLPETASADGMVIGIQGGQGSFNEEACRHYCAKLGLKDFRLEYLYTAVNVLQALHTGEVDRGVFAIQNARGGVVMETIHGLSRYQCEILDIFDIVISHCVMHHPEASITDIDTIISHPQALAQCTDSLAARYGHLKLASGEGDLIDQALCAAYIAQGKLPRSTAVLAPRVCADLYGLKIDACDLQDLGSANLTTFVWVQRRHYFR